MSSDDLAISVRGLSKTYTIRHGSSDHVTLTEAALSRLRHPLRRSPREDFFALRGVDLDVHQGEVLGVIGRNGAGKSTLLKILSRITDPTAGRIDLWGRVGSLLEVGTGFHPELTGRENIFLNGSILGMTRREIERQFSAIVEFASIERFLDTPVKRYSSGMYVRLAFAVAAHLETEILIVDEVLAVGDAQFQEKCLGKMHDVAQAGRTVVLVSHQMQSIDKLCDRAVLLDAGTVAFEGRAPEAIARYLQAGLDPASAGRRSETSLPSVHVRECRPDASSYSPADIKRIEVTVEAGADLVPGTWVSVHVVDPIGAVVAQCDSRLAGVTLQRPGTHRLVLELRGPWLKEGRYTVDTFICNSAVLDRWVGACAFDVLPHLPYAHGAPPESYAAGAVLADFSYDESGPASDAPARAASDSDPLEAR
jgi:lipopolysaccharide transport system ATP-binding protein